MSDSQKIELDSNIDITAIESLYGDFEKVLNSGGNVEIDAAKVERVDSSSLQLILAFQTAMSVHGCEIKWLSISENLEKTAELLGVREKLFS